MFCIIKTLKKHYIVVLVLFFLMRLLPIKETKPSSSFFPVPLLPTPKIKTSRKFNTRVSYWNDWVKP